MATGSQRVHVTVPDDSESGFFAWLLIARRSMIEWRLHKSPNVILMQGCDKRWWPICRPYSSVETKLQTFPNEVIDLKLEESPCIFTRAPAYNLGRQAFKLQASRVIWCFTTGVTGFFKKNLVLLLSTSSVHWFLA
jgi:hypothetical protein